MPNAQIQVPFAGGPDESVDPRLMPAGSVVSATNQVYDLDGSYQPRFGYTALGTTALAQVLALKTYRNELDAIDGVTLYAYDDNAAQFVAKDEVSPVGVTHRQAMNATATYQSWAEACGGGAAPYNVVAWIDSTDRFPRAAVYDATTGALVSIAVLTSAQPCCNVTAGIVGTTAIVTAAVSGTNIIYGFTRALAPLGGAWSGATSIQDTHYASTTGVQATAYSTTDVTLAYEDGSGGLRLVQYTPALALNNSATIAVTASGFTAIGAKVSTQDQLIWVGFLANTSSYSSKYVVQWASQVTLASSATAQGLTGAAPGGSSLFSSIGIERLNATQIAVIVTDGQTTFYGLMQSGGLSGSLNTVFNSVLASAPKSLTSGIVVCYLRDTPTTSSGASIQGSYFLVSLFFGASALTPQLLAVLAPTIANPPGSPGGSGISNIPLPTLSASNAAPSLFETVLPLSRASAGRQGLDFFTVDIYAPYRWRGEALGKELYLGAAYYDGNVVVEAGFPQVPAITHTTVNSGTGVTRQYCVTYARVDASGNLEESAPSAVVSVTSGGPPNVTLTVRTACITQKQRLNSSIVSSAIYVLVYRTPDPASGDSNFYLVAAEPFPLSDANVQTAATFTITDNAVTDATIQAQKVLYTVSGELAHDTPESFTDAVAHMDRIWGIGADQRTIWYSQIYSDSAVPAWSRIQQITVDDTNEPLTALASLYDRLLVFTATRVYVIFGQGPAITGAGNDLTEPQRLPSPCGCVDPRSRVNTPLGVMFQSRRGIELVGPDASVSFIGQPIALTTAAYPICTGAALCENTSTVRFTFVTADYPSASASGVVVLFDLRRNRWATHSLTRGGASTSAVLAASQAATWHPQLGFVEGHNDIAHAACVVSRENTAADATPWLDYGSYFVPLSITTAWIKSGDLQGWQRVRRIRALAQFYTPHGLSFTLGNDFQTPSEVHAYTDSQVSGFVTGQQEQVRIIPMVGKCEAVQVTLSTTAPTVGALGTGRGAGFTGLAFEILAKQGGWRNFAPSQLS